MTPYPVSSPVSPMAEPGSETPGMWRWIRPHWTALLLAFLAAIGETIADVLQPWPIKLVLDNVVQNKALSGWQGRAVALVAGGGAWSILAAAVTAVIVFAVIGAVGSYWEKYLTTSVSQWVGHDLRRQLYQQMQRLSLAEHSETHKGDLLTRMTSDISAIQDFITSALLGIVVNVLTLAGMIGVMLYYSWRFTLLALAVSPALMAVVYVYTPRIKKASRAVKKKESELLSGMSEVLSSIHVVQAFARESYEDRRFESESRQQVEAGLAARSTKAKLTPIVEVIVAVGTALVLGYGGKLAVEEKISPGILVMFVFYLGKMYKPMRDLSKMSDTVTKASVGYERVQELLGVESRISDRPGAREAPRFSGLVEFDRVGFSYNGGSPALSNVSVRIEPGQVAALVGPSGAGKSTMASLVPRFYDPLSGSVRIDGVDIRDYTLKSLRDQISFVLQDTLLFRATIWENIAYGRPDADPEDTVRAAQLANAHDFIMALPQGYATMVGDRGMSLSGGQRQRIAIARAIVRDTPILILDEPTAALDAASEQTVVEALERLMEGRTSIVIAHNLNAVRRADVIFVVKGAEVVEQGTHESLLAHGGVYAELCRIQATS
jgi:ATP-binding cassette, subfamily B, bacterial